MTTTTEHSDSTRRRPRGGSRNAPIHLAQMLVATVLLVVAPFLFVQHQWAAGAAAMLLGMALSLYQFKA